MGKFHLDQINPRIFLDPDNPYAFFNTLKWRNTQNKNNITIMTGEVRSGKSYSAIKIGEILDPDFDVTEHLFFNPTEFFKYFKTATEKTIIFDEGSEAFDRRTWYDIINRIMGSLVTRTGYQKNNLFITLPIISDLDVRIIRKIHFHLIALYYNMEKQMNVLKAHRMKTIFEIGKSYHARFPRLINLSMASKKNIKNYDKMKLEWNQQTDIDKIAMLESLENPETYMRRLSAGEYISLVRAGSINGDEFRDKMKRLNFGEDDIEFIINSVKDNNGHEEDEQTIQDREEFMNAEQQVLIDMQKEKLRQEVIKRELMEIDLNNRYQEEDKKLKDQSSLPKS